MSEKTFRPMLTYSDEAHRLYRRKNLPGAHLYKKFDSINREIMADKFTHSEDDLTELDWIIKSSRLQVLFYDAYQTIRVTDIGRSRFEAICRPHLYKNIELFSQMRCKGGNGYYEYVKMVLESIDLDIRNYRKINNYEVKVFDSINDLFSIIDEKNNEENLCKVVTGPGWSINEDIIIDGNTFCWAKGKNDSPKEADTAE